MRSPGTPAYPSIRVVHSRWQEPFCTLDANKSIPSGRVAGLVENISKDYTARTGKVLPPPPVRENFDTCVLQFYFLVEGWQEFVFQEHGFESPEAAFKALDIITVFLKSMSALRWKTRNRKETMDEYLKIKKEIGKMKEKQSA